MTTRKNIHDLAAAVGVDEKKTRAILRSMGRKLVGDVRAYSFNAREFNTAVREVKSKIHWGLSEETLIRAERNARSYR